ncbi:hypothetical protein [Bradyrhizobium sp. USDA 10063]
MKQKRIPEVESFDVRKSRAVSGGKLEKEKQTMSVLDGIKDFFGIGNHGDAKNDEDAFSRNIEQLKEQTEKAMERGIMLRTITTSLQTTKKAADERVQ